MLSTLKCLLGTAAFFWAFCLTREAAFAAASPMASPQE
jgi:hypothetical protein